MFTIKLKEEITRKTSVFSTTKTIFVDDRVAEDKDNTDTI